MPGQVYHIFKCQIICFQLERAWLDARCAKYPVKGKQAGIVEHTKLNACVQLIDAALDISVISIHYCITDQ